MKRQRSKDGRLSGRKERLFPPQHLLRIVNEELEFYGSAIFQSLGYPLQKTPGSGFSLKTNREVDIRPSKQALAQFSELLERWRRSPGERFNEMLNGRKLGSEQAVDGNPH